MSIMSACSDMWPSLIILTDTFLSALVHYAAYIIGSKFVEVVGYAESCNNINARLKLCACTCVVVSCRLLSIVEPHYNPNSLGPCSACSNFQIREISVQINEVRLMRFHYTSKLKQSCIFKFCCKDSAEPSDISMAS